MAVSSSVAIDQSTSVSPLVSSGLVSSSAVVSRSVLFSSSLSKSRMSSVLASLSVTIYQSAYVVLSPTPVGWLRSSAIVSFSRISSVLIGGTSGISAGQSVIVLDTSMSLQRLGTMKLLPATLVSTSIHGSLSLVSTGIILPSTSEKGVSASSSIGKSEFF